jgi:positive regulator of sigma E activity
MPDWVTHLGTTYLGTRIARVREVQLVLLGSILPDVILPSFVLIDLLHLPVSSEVFAYLLSFQSLIISSLLAAAVSLLHVQPLRCFLLVFCGAAAHFVLDTFETDIDCGLRIFSPFSFRSWSPGWLAPGRTLSTVLLIVSALTLALAVRRRSYLAKVAFKPTRQKLCGALTLTILAFLVPYTIREQVVNHNVHSLAFLANPSAWQEHSVDLCFSEVMSKLPLQVKELDREFELVTTEELDVGQRVSVRGMYRDGKIYPARLQIHAGFFEAWLSVAGLLVFLLFWLPNKLTRSL